MKKFIGPFGVFLALAASGAHRALADGFIELGTTYLIQQPGTLVSGGPFAGVTFDPTPFGPGGANVEIQRQNDLAIDGTAQPIRVVGFEAHSDSPVHIGGSFFDVFVTLDPAHLSDDTGSVALTGDLSGGTFTESVNYFLKFHLEQVGNPSNTMDRFAEITGNTIAPETWSPTPPSGAIVVPSSDVDNGGDNLFANLQGDLGQDEVDFFPTEPIMTHATGSGGGSANVTFSVTVPEPGTTALIVAALLGMAGLRRRAQPA
jgi:hypothetical protein